MKRRWLQSLVILAALVLVTSGCAATQPLATNSPESSPSSETSPSTTAESPTPSTAPIVTATPSTAPASPKPAVLTITSASFHAGEVGIAYAPVTLTASGGVPPYSWAISVGALPGGLHVASGGSVSGTPTGAGTFAFTVHVADTASGSAIVNRSISVARHLTVSGSCAAQPCVVEQGCTTVCGGLGSKSGGVGPYTYTPQGTLPTGMGLSGLTLTGAFPLGSFKFGVLVKDALGATGSVPAAFDVFAHIAFKGGSGSGKVASAFSFRLPYSGGTPGGTPAVTYTGTLPPGTTIAVDTKNLLIVFSIPAQRVAAKYSATVVLTDAGICGPSVGQHCTAAGTVTITVA